MNINNKNTSLKNKKTKKRVKKRKQKELIKEHIRKEREAKEEKVRNLLEPHYGTGITLSKLLLIDKSDKNLYYKQLEEDKKNKIIQDVLEPIYREKNSINELLIELENIEGIQSIRNKLGPKFGKRKSVKELLILEYEQFIKDKLVPEFGKGYTIKELLVLEMSKKYEFEKNKLANDEKIIRFKLEPKYGLGLSIEELLRLERLENIELMHKNISLNDSSKLKKLGDQNKDKITNKSYDYKQKLWGSNH